MVLCDFMCLNGSLQTQLTVLLLFQSCCLSFTKLAEKIRVYILYIECRHVKWSKKVCQKFWRPRYRSFFDRIWTQTRESLFLSSWKNSFSDLDRNFDWLVLAWKSSKKIKDPAEKIQNWLMINPCQITWSRCAHSPIVSLLCLEKIKRVTRVIFNDFISTWHNRKSCHFSRKKI